MNLDKITGFGLFALAVGLVASSILGPLWLESIQWRISDNMENQVLGSEIVSLLLAAPAALGASYLWLRGHPLAPVLALTASVYSLYTYITMVLGPEYDRYPGNNEDFFPLYLAIIILSWVIALGAIRRLNVATLPALGDILRRALAGALIAFSLFLGFAWAADIIEVINGGIATQEYTEHPTVFWVIKLLDTAFVIPGLFIIGVGLALRRDFAARTALAASGPVTCLAASVLAMAVVMEWNDDPSAAWPLLALFLVAFLVFAALTAQLERWYLAATRGDNVAITPHHPSTINS